MRKTMLAIGAALALGAATMVTGAMAAPPGGFGGGGGGAHVGAGAGGGGGGPGGGGGRVNGGAQFGGGNFAAGPRNGGANFAAGPNNFNHNHGNFAFRGRRFQGGPGVGLYAYGGGYPWWGYNDCWVRRWVWTPYGWRWRLVEVC